MTAALHRRPCASAMAAVALALAVPVVALAETPPGTYGGEPGDVAADPGLLPLLLGIVAVVLVIAGVLALIRRLAPRALRPLAALLTLGGTVLAVVFVLLLGILSSWTDDGSNVPLPFLIAAGMVGIGGGIAAIWVLRGRRPPEPAPDPTTPV